MVDMLTNWLRWVLSLFGFDCFKPTFKGSNTETKESHAAENDKAEETEKNDSDTATCNQAKHISGQEKAKPDQEKATSDLIKDDAECWNPEDDEFIKNLMSGEINIPATPTTEDKKEEETKESAKEDLKLEGLAQNAFQHSYSEYVEGEEIMYV